MSDTTYDIMLDLDNVLYPFIRTFHTWLETLYPKPVPFNNRSWTFYREMGVKDDDFKSHLRQYGATGGFGQDVSPIDAIHPLVNLWDRGHRIHIVTHRPDHPQVTSDTVTWLRRWGVPYDTLTIGGDKAAFLGWSRSSTTWALDDAPQNVDHLRSRGVRAFLYAQPHNADVQALHKVARSTQAFAYRVLNNRWSV